MDGYEANKIFAAILLALVVMMGGYVVSTEMIQPKFPKKDVYTIEGGEVAREIPSQKKELESIIPLLPKASVDRGKSLSKRCVSCHTFHKNGRTGIGPNLYGVLNAPMAHIKNYSYSSALKNKAQDDKVWSAENLNKFLYRPNQYIPRTKMSFAGLKKAQDRADVVAYLNSKSDAPVDLTK